MALYIVIEFDKRAERKYSDGRIEYRCVSSCFEGRYNHDTGIIRSLRQLQLSIAVEFN